MEILAAFIGALVGALFQSWVQRHYDLKGLAGSLYHEVDYVWVKFVKSGYASDNPSGTILLSDADTRIYLAHLEKIALFAKPFPGIVITYYNRLQDAIKVVGEGKALKREEAELLQDACKLLRSKLMELRDTTFSSIFARLASRAGRLVLGSPKCPTGW